MNHKDTSELTLTEPQVSVPRRATDKWGDAARAGFQVVPDLLLKNQERLGLSSTDIVVLLNITMHWWYPEQKPFPRTSTIANRMGTSARTVQRSIEALQAKGLLRRVPGGDDSQRTYLDPDGLVARLEALAQGDRDFLIREGRRIESLT